MKIMTVSIHFLFFSKKPISLDESFKFQRILALGCLKMREQLIFWWGGDMTSVWKVRTPWSQSKTQRQDLKPFVYFYINLPATILWHKQIIWKIGYVIDDHIYLGKNILLLKIKETVESFPHTNLCMLFSSHESKLNRKLGYADPAYSWHTSWHEGIE